MFFHHALLLVLVLAFEWNVGCAKKMILSEYDNMELGRIKKYNQTRLKFGLTPIEFNLDIMRIAQKHADLMKTTPGVLTKPKFSIAQNYRGFITILTDKIGNKKRGTKLCFSSLTPNAKTEIIDINKQCDQGMLDWRYEYEVGYGRSVDENKNIYGVRIYLTRQKAMEDPTSKPSTISTENPSTQNQALIKIFEKFTTLPAEKETDDGEDENELDLKENDTTDTPIQSKPKLDQDSLNLIEKIIDLLKNDGKH